MTFKKITAVLLTALIIALSLGGCSGESYALKIDGNKFYEVFFDDYSIGDVIELQKGKSVNDKEKLSIATFNTLNKLINDIVEKIEEQKED